MHDARDHAAFFLNLSRTGGDVVPFRIDRRPAFLVNDPALAEVVMTDDGSRFDNPYHQYRELAGFMRPAGRALLAIRNAPRSAAASHVELLDALARERVAAWIESDEPVAIEVEAKRLSFRATVRSLFGIDVDSCSDAFVRATNLLEELWINRAEASAEAAATQNAIADEIGVRAGLAGSDGTIHPATRLTIVRTLLNAYNATGVAITWTLYLLAQHPEVVERIRAEGRKRRTSLLRMTVFESLRLYPPAWNLGRTARTDVRIGDAAIPRGAAVFVCPYAMHRRPSLWERPSEFDPGRFRTPPAHPFAWIPFGGGDRRCPAAPLAPHHVQVVVGAIVERVNLALASPPTRPRGLVALRPMDEVRIRFS